MPHANRYIGVPRLAVRRGVQNQHQKRARQAAPLRRKGNCDGNGEERSLPAAGRLRCAPFLRQGTFTAFSVNKQDDGLKKEHGSSLPNSNFDFLSLCGKLGS